MTISVLYFTVTVHQFMKIAPQTIILCKVAAKKKLFQTGKTLQLEMSMMF